MIYGYEEYLEYINETYEEFKDDEKMSNKEAIARTFNEYDMLAKESETDKAIIYVVLTEILVSHSRILHTFKAHMIKMLSELDFYLIEQEQKLTLVQYNDLRSRKENVLPELENKKLDYYPRVCWYYYDLTDEVNKFFNQINTDNVTIDEIVISVFRRFERDCKNTLSEKIIVYTTLAEKLLTHKLTQTDALQKIRQELQQFNIKDILQEQLLEEEQMDLEKRIKNVLNQINFS
ncbi:Imm3 family immunity protein [Paenibacillus sp. NRS-1782]|uniref:Imm3 family immunity protein n=1 Tax=unclassified Paenibacillus TaxID=185978 RepID=UPI003D2A0C40